MEHFQEYFCLLEMAVTVHIADLWPVECKMLTPNPNPRALETTLAAVEFAESDHIGLD
jgi:hypothetical protein